MCQLRLMRSRCRDRIRNRGLLQWWPTGQLEKSARGTTVRRHHALTPARSIPGTVWPMRICWWSMWCGTCRQTTRNSYGMLWAVSPAKGSTQKQANDVVVIYKQTGLRAGNPEVKLACSLLRLLQRGTDFQAAESSSPHVTLSMLFLFPKCYLPSRLQTKLVFLLGWSPFRLRTTWRPRLIVHLWIYRGTGQWFRHGRLYGTDNQVSSCERRGDKSKWC